MVSLREHRGRETVETDVTAGLGARRAARIRQRILKWGRANFRSYPWREENDPWLTLVAELLLQRTRATQVEPVFREFCLRYPTAMQLATAGEDAAREVMGKLGLYFRGPQLHRLAMATAELGGKPPVLESLQALAGIGPYTTAAWLSLHQRKRAVIIDANIARWLSRVTGLPYNRDPRHVRWVNRLADVLTPRRSFRDYNYAVLDFTMEVCTARTPHCDVCPIRADCTYFSRIDRRAPEAITSNRSRRSPGIGNARQRGLGRTIVGRTA
jgi:A/G-specific adenine glycosylase